MGKKERDLINDRLLNLKENERLFRINSAMGWAGKVVKHTGKFIILSNPYPIHSAPEGWPDLCGWQTVTVTEDMIGQKVAVFVGEEVKATGKLSKEQNRFRDIILKMGGIFRILK